MCDPQCERCRLCGKQDYKLTTVETNISKRIKVLFHLEVNIYCDKDKLPKSICSNCMFSVDSCWKFYLQVHRTQCELANANKKDFTDEEDPLVHIKLEPKLEVVESKDSVNNDCIEDSHVSDDDNQWTDSAVKPQKSNLKQHMLSYSIERPFSCDICHNTFKENSRLKTHILSVHSDKNSQSCETCGKKLNTIKNLRNHRYLHKKEKSHKCSFCEKAFKTKGELISHERHHTGEQPFSCTVCNRKFRSLGNRLKHMRRIHKLSPRENDVNENKEEQLRETVTDLQIEFISCKEEPGVHREQEHPQREEPKKPAYFNLTCEECGKTYANKYGLKLHMALHTGELPFTCDICAKGFPFASTLKCHVLKDHTNPEHLLHCDQCGQTCLTKGYLKQHMITHAKDRPFTCDICHKTFKTKSQIKHHIFTHSDKKSHACETCGKKFLTIKHLRDHRYMHRKEKSNKCSFCEKAFKVKKHLISHERQHNGEQPFSCTVCDRKFTFSGNRLKHMRRMHKLCLREKDIQE